MKNFANDVYLSPKSQPWNDMMTDNIACQWACFIGKIKLYFTLFKLKLP